MSEHYASFEQSYHGLDAIWLRYGAYEAVAIPGIGGNLVAFRDTEKKLTILREPGESEIEQFRKTPAVYGIPVLFPPNRYEDGKFAWKGTTYQLPINEPENNNHLHGFVHEVPWTVEGHGANALESYLVMSQHVSEGHPMYHYLPFTFTITLRYSLCADGLQQQLTIRNEGKEEMPNLIAFHTAINAPFAEESTADDYSLTLTMDKRRELNERSLPTGKFQTLTHEEELMKSTGINPYFEAMDNHYTAQPVNGRNVMELTDTKQNITLVYDAGTSYKHWMVWNCGASRQFFCPEPQMNMINAPNVQGMDPEEIGLVGLAPGDIFEETSRLYIKS
ncbi:aldose 1-epimerase [Paenibacillus sp. JX-17]|uniref:Aldose 1-epimerase n=1 Tax=Paenibacillus lacisoli TaxID=3064525 RepID=A0ABT9C7I8_9BACL|nr:aldose 1-epimerase [Paenibacillus sp. JX-17]MDO7904855.1 aldose 1-epimerase [Paenibacillus sp. JX-17]